LAADMKHGSCSWATNDCWRYRPAARIAQSIDMALGHPGFSCVVRSAD